MFARVTVMEGGAPEALDESTRVAEETVLPRARQMDGWRGVISLGNRRNGKQVLITLWDSEEAMGASSEQARGLRSETQTGGERETAVEGFEVLMFEGP